MIEKQFDTGYVRVNLFTETIKDAIESQSNLLPGGGSITTFSAIDEVDTDGVEFVFNRYSLFVPELDVRFNLTYTKSTIVDNSTAEGANPAITIEGNDYPRLPRWRSNLMMTYHASDRWDISGTLQYADKSFGRLDNMDTARKTMGAQDGNTRLGFKTTYDLSDQLELGFGIDNLTNESAFVAHPWPGRTFYLNLSYGLSQLGKPAEVEDFTFTAIVSDYAVLIRPTVSGRVNPRSPSWVRRITLRSSDLRVRPR